MPALLGILIVTARPNSTSTALALYGRFAAALCRKSLSSFDIFGAHSPNE
jgi:hypothetical protein